VFVDDATAVNGIAGLNLFDFLAGTVFTPGSQRPPADPALFGTTGGSIDNAIATLGNFDANSIVSSESFGFVSLGDNGSVGFNLLSPIAPTESLYVYIGEVGDNGEVAAGQVIVSDAPIDPTPVPEPISVLGFLLTGLALAWRRV
jgi:hypothetical protein